MRSVTGEWGTIQELAALLVEISYESYRAFLAANGVKRGRLPPPLRVPRPHSTKDESGPRPTRPKRKHASSVAEVVAVLATSHRR